GRGSGWRIRRHRTRSSCSSVSSVCCSPCAGWRRRGLALSSIQSPAPHRLPVTRRHDRARYTEDVITIERISKTYGGQALLHDCSWRIGRGERIGLVGPNGAGKTTLCRILAGVEEPDAGRVHRDSGVSVGYLPQEVSGAEELTVLAEALSGYEEVWRLESELAELAERMASDTADDG